MENTTNQNNNEGAANTNPVSQADNRKLMGILSYLGVLVIIPLIVNKDDQFIKFHSKQGLLVFIGWLIANAVWMLPMGGLVAPLINLGCLALAILGVLNVLAGNQKELPLVGHLASNFTF